MTLTPLTLKQNEMSGRLGRLLPGEYCLQYHDSTHLPENHWVDLATVAVKADLSGPIPNDTTEQSYTVTKAICNQLPGSGGEKGGTEVATRVIEDTLALALARIGLLAPQASTDLLLELKGLESRDGVVIVPDTNSLYNGAVHWLLRVLNRQRVWLMPIVASMTTIQAREAQLKSLVGKRQSTQIGQALRSRALVNGSMGLLERNRGRCQIVEIDPSLLRYQKMASNRGSDPDQGDVLEDRLIIEAIHTALRTMRSRTARRVVTSDVFVARMLAAEGIEVLFVPVATLVDDPINCVRFDAPARGFVGAPLRSLIWELAHAFGSVRLAGDCGEVVRVDTYWPGKTPGEWAAEALKCEFGQLQSGSNEGFPAPTRTRLETKSTDRPEPRANIVGSATRTLEAPDERGVKPKRASSGEARHSVERPQAIRSSSYATISTPIPRASLPQMLRLLGSACRLKEADANRIVAGLREQTISVDKARRALEVLRRLRLLEQHDDLYRPTDDVGVVRRALAVGDLDSLDAIFTRFAPYEVFQRELQSRRNINRSEVSDLVIGLLGSVGIQEAKRLPHLHILLGKAWTQGELILDGSERPTDSDATSAFEEAFKEVARSNIARVQDFLESFCLLTRSSPWAAKRQIERLSSTRMLPGYLFQPSVGNRPVTRDEVIAGGLDDAFKEPVVIDHLLVQERPVFMIARRAS